MASHYFACSWSMISGDVQFCASHCALTEILLMQNDYGRKMLFGEVLNKVCLYLSSLGFLCQYLHV